MPICKNYITPHSIEKAFQALEEAGNPVRLVAGGTDLLLDIQQGKCPPADTLVDVTCIPELQRLELFVDQSPERKNSLFVGAAIPLRVLETSPVTRQHARALAEACGLMAGPQVRNVATLGGNVVHALPAADGAIALLALGARVEIASRNGIRWVDLTELYQGPGKSTLNAREDILVGFHLPAWSRGQASAFSRIMRKQGVALPILNMAVWLERKDDYITDIRLSLGPAGLIPQRCKPAEETLRGKVLSEKVCQEAYQALLESLHFRTSPYRASAEYRQHLCRVLLNKVLYKAWERAA